jgi:hypothetical protein
MGDLSSEYLTKIFPVFKSDPLLAENILTRGIHRSIGKGYDDLLGGRQLYAYRPDPLRRGPGLQGKSQPPRDHPLRDRPR